MSDAYDMIDRFLRNNLGSDDDYAEYSKALDSLCCAQPAQAGQVHCPNGDKCKHGSWCSETYCQEHCQFRQAGQVPELTSTEVNDACWAFVEALPHQLTGAIFNDLKPAIYAAICKYLEQAVLAKRVPMQQISDGEFAPDAKLLELADKIDHEQNWRHSGIFQRDHLTQDQKDRVLAGVMLRRYADLMAPESWRLFPPKSVVSHSYRAATLEAVVKMAERHGIVGEKGGA